MSWSRNPHPTHPRVVRVGHEPGESSDTFRPRPGSEDSQSCEQLETLRDIAAQLVEDGAARSAEWVLWAADEIETLRAERDRHLLSLLESSVGVRS